MIVNSHFMHLRSVCPMSGLHEMSVLGKRIGDIALEETVATALLRRT